MLGFKVPSLTEDLVPDMARCLLDSLLYERAGSAVSRRLLGARKFSQAEETMKLQKKLQKLIPVGTLLLLSVTTLAAQNSLPDPRDGSCWESLSALRGCQMEQYNRAMDEAERCTSYPEYQCMPASEPSDSREEMAKGTSKPNHGKTSAAAKQGSVPYTSAQPVLAQAAGSN
jgi:hypothetical protein